MSDVVERLRAVLSSGPNTVRTPWGVTVEEAADEIERLRAALEKIAGVREYDQADFEACARYKPDKGLWTLDEYVADAALDHQERGEPLTIKHHGE